MSLPGNDHNPGGFLTFIVTITATTAFIIYMSVIHPGVSNNPLQKLPEAEKRTADNKVWEASPEQVEKGKGIYTQQCVTCHGDQGKGDGPAGVALKARNFTSNDNWKNGSSPFAMFKTVTEGIAGTGMAPFASLPDSDKWAVVHYVRKTFVQSPKEATEEEIKAFLGK